LNKLQRQWNLNVETFDLFDKIFNDQIWNTHYDEIFKIQRWSEKIIQKIKDKKQKLKSQLQVVRNIMLSISIFFNFIKQSQKLLNSSLFTDEIEFIWDD
jgi:hypothetical protein